MTLKINYLDQKKGLIKSKAYFVNSSFKISEFQGEFDKEIQQKINNFLKKNKNLKDNKILCLNADFEHKLLIIILSKKNNELLSEKLGAKFLDYLKNNEISEIQIIKPSPSIIKNKFINYNSFLHGAELRI